MAFLAELKRRRVGKVAIAYAAVSWGITEACSVVLPALRLPEWTMTFVVVFLMVGFPVAMVLAWIFDVGPEGIQRTEPQPGPDRVRLQLRAAYGLVVLACMAGLGYLLYERGLGRAHAGEPHSSIAVLPFTNLSGDASKEYFSDGMSEELLNLLARVPGLQVASRTSSFAYKGRNLDVREVGRELGVETVLEGSVRQAGEQVRITAQLIDADTGFHLWSETYDRRLEDIFRVQDEIAGAIVDRLKLQLAPEERQAAQRDKPPTQNLEAYELYLQARAIWKRRGAENLRRAIDLYQAAISRDPAFARAHAGLASAYVVLPGYLAPKSVAEQVENAQRYEELATAAARQALALDPNLGDAHAVLAEINFKRGNLLDAESGFFFAISLEPSEPTPHHWYSLLLQATGRLEAALAEASRAYELDPTAPVIAGNLAAVYLMLGRDTEAEKYARTARDLGIGDGLGIEQMLAQRRGDYALARKLVLEKGHFPPELRDGVEQFWDAMADPALRPAALATLDRVDPKLFPDQERVSAYLMLGDTGRAMASLQRAARAGVGEDGPGFSGLAILWHPEAAALRRDPAFPGIAKELGLVDYWRQYGYADACRPAGRDGVACS